MDSAETPLRLESIIEFILGIAPITTTTSARCPPGARQYDHRVLLAAFRIVNEDLQGLLVELYRLHAKRLRNPMGH